MKSDASRPESSESAETSQSGALPPRCKLAAADKPTQSESLRSGFWRAVKACSLSPRLCNSRSLPIAPSGLGTNPRPAEGEAARIPTKDRCGELGESIRRACTIGLCVIRCLYDLQGAVAKPVPRNRRSLPNCDLASYTESAALQPVRSQDAISRKSLQTCRSTQSL
mgnify:CR=1 FL=1|jgi:hypothetical protein